MPTERYKRTCVRIGIIVLVNTLLLQVLTTASALFCSSNEATLRELALLRGIDPDEFFYAFDEVCSLLAYLISFLLPAFLFMLLSRRDVREPMRLGVKLAPNAPLVIIGAVGIIIIAAYINSLMVSFIDFSSVFESPRLDTPVKIMLAFISTAVVPAVAEEFLFRGCILSNLLPYGKAAAIVISSLLFALMHGNFAQFFYTFIAGLILAAVYIETGSIWTSTFIHLFNNFYGVIQQVIYYRSPGRTTEMLMLALDAAIAFAGLAAVGWLYYGRLKNGAREPLAQPSQCLRLTRGETIKGFFNPVMTAHIILSLLLAVLVVLLALLNSNVN